VKDENGDLFADFCYILNRQVNCFFQLSDVRRVSDIRQTEIRTVVLLVPVLSPSEFEIAIS
jgi:hypothetical protein